MESLDSWFEELRQVNADLLTAAKRAKAEKFLRRSAVEKYVEPTHFIFELLQNADDQEAKKVQFRLLPDRVEFLHWGKPFRRDDVERITRLGDSDKPNEVHKIGSFGIGFKSVFAVTDRPEVYCQLDGRPFAFALEELIVPVALPLSERHGKETLFLLPYSKGASGERSSEAAAQLTKTGPEVLMFLNHIEELVWEDGVGNGERYRRIPGADGIAIFERTKIDAGKEKKHDPIAYRLFRRPVTLPDGRPSETCIAFRLNADGQAVGESSPAKLWVYFETEEQLGFRFRVHGPFKLTDNRANVMRSEPFNQQLIREISGLIATALTELRNEKRLVRETLNALPIPTDDIAENWTGLAETIWQALRQQQVLPTAAGAYANPISLSQGIQDLRAVLDDKDLSLLADQDKFWAVSAGQRNSRIDRLHSHVGIDELTLEGLLKQLESTAQRPGRLQSWLADHDDGWTQKLYLLLNGIKGHQVTRLGSLPMVRTAGGDHVHANAVRFSPSDDGTDRDIEIPGVNIVAPGLLAGRKQVREEVTAFLRRIDVKDVNEEDYIRALLALHYQPGHRVADMNAHRRHLERFAGWLGAHPYQAAIFKGACLFLAEGSDQLQTGGMLFIDKPFLETGLAAVYGPQGPLKNEKRPLGKRYRGIKGVLDFARTLGVIQHLQPARVSTSLHPEQSALWADYYRYGARWGNSTNTDWTIPGLERLLAQPDAAVSLCLWRSLQAFDRSVFFAKFRHAESYPMREKPASFLYQLKSLAWVPCASGGFKKPEDITEQELPPEFDTTDRTGWLEMIGLGSNAKRKAAEYQQQRQIVLRAGIPDEFAEQFQELSEEQRRSVLEAGFRELATSTILQPTFPEREAPNPERRATRMAERARAAPQKTYETRERSVRTSDNESRQLARPYLVDLYTNSANQMVCQACHQVMPFSLADGSPYFEAPELLPEASAELVENHLALCPTCCAKWHHARATSDAEVVSALRSAEAPQITVMLAGETTLIRFVQVHLDDLCAIVSVTVDATAPAETI
ncbi:sacsin N-terminal ATP-binding-like domain-containing protein [Mesorhizobium sp. L-8-3]|uniref:sacsin N-terminal ATP-binding-like domain-containing protein n=1 Tax=Mesorhizobium sp. L-8-3 TaxID=2744522 RepID=UPI0019264066|nr:hypothetical protein [Mesorhizobium sp. L-8-3]BCH27798.1 hypothetical protein MesoLjLb_75830 [Mesorhizobium sp. L-8-3]